MTAANAWKLLRWRGPPLLLTLITAELLALLLAGAWQWNADHARLTRQTEHIAQRVNQVFGEVDRELALIAQKHGTTCSDAAIDAMRRLAFTRDAVREAGIVNDDRLVCTSWGQLPVPILVRPEHRSNIAGRPHIALLLGSGLDIDNNTVSVLYAHTLKDGHHLNALLAPDPLFLPFTHPSAVHSTYWLRLPEGKSVLYHRHGETESPLHVHTEPGQADAGFPLIRAQQSTAFAGVTVEATETRESFLQSLPMRQWPLLVGLPIVVLLIVMLLNRRDATRFSPEDEIRHALELDVFRFHYQPVVDLRNGRTVGCEALMRWHHPQRGILDPSVFLPVATDAGLLAALTLQALRAMVRELEPTLRGFPDLRVSINLDGKDLLDNQLLTDIEAILDSAGIAPTRVVFEITEVSAIEDTDGVAAHAVQRVRALGFGIAIDDFGTGYCSFDYLRRYSADYLKIDRSFVDGLQEPELGAPLLATIVQMAHQMDLRLVAEGIETVEQRDHLLRLGVQSGQGYHYGRAMPAGAFNAFVAHDSRQTDRKQSKRESATY